MNDSTLPEAEQNREVPETPAPVDPVHAAEQAAFQAVHKERRYRLIWIPYEFVVFLLQAGIRWNTDADLHRGVINLPQCDPPLPTDTFVCNIVFSADRDAWMVVVASAQFECVPAGQVAPEHNPNPSWSKVKALTLELAP